MSDSLVYNILSYSPDMLARIDSSGAATIIPNPNQYQNFRGGVVYKDELYLVVEENEPDVGRELWRFSGQTLELAADINTRHVPFNYPVSSSSPDDFVEYRGDLYFTAGPTLENDRELWKFDGATATQVAEIMPRQALGGSTWCGSCVDILGVLDDKLVFTATDDFESASIPSNVNKRWLWTYDGSQIEKVEGIEFSLGRGAGAFTVVHPTEFNGALYFVALADNAGKELWKWDGHSPPTRLTDIQPRAYHSLRSHLIVFKDHLYFPAQEVGGFGRERASVSGGPTATRYPWLQTPILMVRSSRPRNMDFSPRRSWFPTTICTSWRMTAKQARSYGERMAQMSCESPISIRGPEIVPRVVRLH